MTYWSCSGKRGMQSDVLGLDDQRCLQDCLVMWWNFSDSWQGKIFLCSDLKGFKKLIEEKQKDWKYVYHTSLSDNSV